MADDGGQAEVGCWVLLDKQTAIIQNWLDDFEDGRKVGVLRFEKRIFRLLGYLGALFMKFNHGC